MFTNGMAESTSTEPIALPDVDRANFLQLLRFMYTGQVALTNECSLNLLSLAGRFEIAHLAETCTNVCVVDLDLHVPSCGFTNCLYVCSLSQALILSRSK
jgi:hypothetical protein